MTLLYAAPVVMACIPILLIWTEHKERMRKLDIELTELEIELEEIRRENERTD